MPSNAPTLNKMAISSPRPGPGQQPPARPPGPGQPTPAAALPASAERERVAAAVEFGAALEDLVAYARLRQEESDAVPQTSGPRFPPDLLLRRDPEDLLRSTCRKLLRLEPTLLGLGRPDGTMPPNSHVPPTSNGRPAPAIPPNSDEPSASNGPSTSQGVSALDRRSKSTEHPTSAGSSTDQPEEKTSQVGPRNQGEPRSSNGHQPQEGPQTDEALLELEPALPGLDQPGGTMPQAEPRSPEGRPPQEESQTDQPGGKTPQDRSRNQGGRRTPNGHHPQERLYPPPRASGQPGPSKVFKIEERVGALLGASVRGDRESRDLGHRLSDLGELDHAIGEWDEDVVEHIVDTPAVLGGYRVGKALSLTRWKIKVAKQWKQGDADPSVDPWEDAFCKQRVDEIQRHVNSLSTVLDPQAVTAVSTGLGYWRNALLSLTTSASSTRPRSWWRSALMRLASIGESSNAGSRSTQPSSPQTIKVVPEHGEKLLKALEEQIDHWLDLLTEQRSPESFPVAGIVATLTKKMAADLWSRLFRFLIPVVAGVAVLVIVGGLGVAGYMVLSTAPTNAGSGDSNGLLGSLGTAVGGVITFLAVQGRTLLGRGTGNDAWGRNGNGGMRNGGVFPRSNYGVAAAAGVVADLQRDVLSGVVDQLKVEELNLAVSEPLMRCVLAFNDRESKKGDPLKDAERFLRLIYGDKSNLDRLRPVFKDLYKH